MKADGSKHSLTQCFVCTVTELEAGTEFQNLPQKIKDELKVGQARGRDTGRYPPVVLRSFPPEGEQGCIPVSSIGKGL